MWGQNWGKMIWGGAAAVPALSGGMLLILSVALLVVGAKLGKRQRAPRWLPWLTGLAAAFLPTALVSAATFTLPFVFSNGTVADATQVNQNFSTAATEIDSLRKQTQPVTECEFRSRLSSTVVLCAEGQGGAMVFDGTDEFLVGPLHVPSGATITSIDAWVNDTNANANVSICLGGPFDSFGSNVTFNANCATTSGTPGIVKLTLTLPAGTVQGDGAGYELDVITRDNTGTIINWPGSPNQATLTIRTAYVHYELP